MLAFKKTSYALILLFVVSNIMAQTPQQVIVEHFTNTRCSICAAHNPQFYSNLHSNYPQVLHIAYHPSSPYSQCKFSLLNPTENDARTKFYGVYGGTPRAVMQGQVLNNSTPLVANSYYDAALNQQTSFEVKVRMQDIGTDSVNVTTVITTTGGHTYSALSLYAVVTEDTIFYNAPNGETIHFDVFHKQLYPNNGLVFKPSRFVGDSVVLTSTFVLDSSWVKGRVNVTAIVQDTTTKAIVQAARQTVIEPKTVVIATGINTTNDIKPLTIYPNPASDRVFFSDANNKQVAVINMGGKLILTYNVTDEMNIDNLPNGVYTLKIMAVDGFDTYRRLVVAH